MQVSDAEVLITADADVLALFGGLPAAVSTTTPPADSPSKARSFLDEWAPRILIWVAGALRPALLRVVERVSVPALLINAQSAQIFPRGTGWLPRAIRSAVAAFDTILTCDGATATRLIRGGVDRTRVQTTGPIQEEPIPLPHDQYELAVMAEALGTRPFWYALDVPTPEVLEVVAAHQSASRKNHRLMLLLSPREPEKMADLVNQVRGLGLRVGVRSTGAEPEPDTQVYFTDLPAEEGLWCRLSPLTYVGGTLKEGSNVSPFDPIALGSCIVHGTLKMPHEDRYARLSKVEACREVRSTSELGIAVGTLISPERSARMALAGWEELSKTADSINTLVARCAETLEGAT